MSTGVTASDAAATAINNFKLGKGEKLRYITCVIEDKKTIVVESTGPKSKTYEEFCETLPETECRYSLVDLEFTTADGRPTSKIVLITWAPDTASIRDKMLYAGSKEAMKSASDGIGIHINCTDRSELDFETSILDQLRKF